MGRTARLPQRARPRTTGRRLGASCEPDTGGGRVQAAAGRIIEGGTQGGEVIGQARASQGRAGPALRLDVDHVLTLGAAAPLGDLPAGGGGA